jgi:hypothetical protein
MLCDTFTLCGRMVVWAWCFPGLRGQALAGRFAPGTQCGLSYIVADFRQIIWRESLRSLCKHSTRAPTVLPHNVAWPFLPFWSWCGRPGSAAMICGRKRPLTLNLASMLRQMVLPDNVAPSIFPQIFLGVDPKIYGKHVFGRSRHIMRQKWPAAHTETHDICASIFSVTFPCFMPITYKKYRSLASNQARHECRVLCARLCGGNPP